ncbi:MAG: 1-(5-phosphoribosyl)-5-[(5-phosphoribosylamino)methylideneamino]imidazole-4-carboxamide isomerase [Dehalococcoidia bacterium]|nr:1-(5-phosphoribosyl)-5-[(5-phosphoribosylamino)methylideneamino]imidazole-4-carboxamide isomerase [Dehalococcoidia bacterium]
MDVIPAIDLHGGLCVRLYQGDYTKEQVFSNDPVAMAHRWQQEGATLLHVVDLDGAATGNPANLSAIERIAKETSLHVEVGGGIRTVEIARRILSLGIQRVFLGTVAVEQPEIVAQMLHAFGAERVGVGIDARNGKVAVKGWKEQSSVDALTLLESMSKIGVRVFDYTDISRDGAGTEPNFDALAEAVAHVRGDIIAAGGVTSVEHVRRLKAVGVAGCIIGRALYTGDIKLPEALAAARDTQQKKKQ